MDILGGQHSNLPLYLTMKKNCFVFSILGFCRETESVGDIAASLWEEIYYKQLALGNMEVDKSQDLQSKLASWRPGRADVSVKCKGKTKSMSQLKAGNREESFLKGV